MSGFPFRGSNSRPPCPPGIVLIAPLQDPVIVDRYQYEVRLSRRGDGEGAVDEKLGSWRRNVGGR
jgi:hypothetical protein